MLQPSVIQHNDELSAEDTRNDKYPLRRRTAVNYNFDKSLENDDLFGDDDVVSDDSKKKN